MCYNKSNIDVFESDDGPISELSQKNVNILLDILKIHTVCNNLVESTFQIFFYVSTKETEEMNKKTGEGFFFVI